MSKEPLPVYRVVVGQALPDLGLFVRVDGALLAGLASGFTFSLRVRDPLDAATLFTKTTGFTGQTGAGSEPGGTPNLVVAWAATGELDQLTPGEQHRSLLNVVRQSDSKPFKYQFLIFAAPDS
jgi:hypothetical protein